MVPMSDELVLVTGGSGFIGTHCILQLLAAGYRVRATIRNLKREGDVRAMLKQGGAEPGNRLSLVAADLQQDYRDLPQVELHSRNRRGASRWQGSGCRRASSAMRG